MFEKIDLDALSRRLAEVFPSGVGSDVEKSFRAILQGTFDKLSLVSREEFEVQSAVLAKTRAKLEALEAQLAALEQRVFPDR